MVLQFYMQFLIGSAKYKTLKASSSSHNFCYFIVPWPRGSFFRSWDRIPWLTRKPQTECKKTTYPPFCQCFLCFLNPFPSSITKWILKSWSFLSRLNLLESLYFDDFPAGPALTRVTIKHRISRLLNWHFPEIPQRNFYRRAVPC